MLSTMKSTAVEKGAAPILYFPIFSIVYLMVNSTYAVSLFKVGYGGKMKSFARRYVPGAQFVS